LAVRVVEHEAGRQLPITAREIARAVPEHIPVHHGVAKRLTRVTVEPRAQGTGGHPRSVVEVKSPFWHFLEFGTRFNPPYRPIQRAVESLHMRLVRR
jgi:hypothetical protein